MRKLNITILVGLLVAVLGAVLVFSYGNNVDKRVADGKELVDVLVADDTLAAGMSPADLAGKVSVHKVPRDYLATDILTTLDTVKGQVLLGPTAKGVQLTSTSFGQPGSTGAVKPSVGNIALAVGVDLTPGVARYVAAGSSVDMFVTYAGTMGRTANRTKLFMSGARVLSVTIAPPPATKDGEVAAAANATTNQVVVVVDVSPRDAEKVVNATVLGRVYLALSAVDGKGDEHKTPSGVVPDDVVDSNK